MKFHFRVEEFLTFLVSSFHLSNEILIARAGQELPDKNLFLGFTTQFSPNLKV